MADFEFDLITIGAGSGGVRASRFAAEFGARVALIESAYLGGTCVNAGCVPKKLLSYAAHFKEDFEDAQGYGWTWGAKQFDWPGLIAAKDAHIAYMNSVYERHLLDAGVTVIRGTAILEGPNRVSVGAQKFSARRVLVATGSKPVLPAIEGSEHFITSNEAFHLQSLPERVVVYGAGYIGVEFASIFNGLGANTSLVFRAASLLPGFDAELGPRLAAEMAQKGLTLYPNERIERIVTSQTGPRFRAVLVGGTVLEADCVLAATGRIPNSDGLGLAKLGVQLGPLGAICIDESFSTNIPSIHAIGDVTDRIQLTPVALAEGMAFADRWFGSNTRRVAYEHVPTAVFSHPNVACVGLTEEGARAAGYTLRIFKQSFHPLKQALSHRRELTFMKLVVDASTDRVLGVHMLGPEAGEVVQGFAVALNCGATKAQFDHTIGIHPTVAEEFLTMRTEAGTSPF